MNDSVLPCFFFYEQFDSLSLTDIQIKTDFKYTIVSPFRTYNPPKPIENMTQYEVTLKMCTLYKGVPYGPAHIQYTHHDPNHKSRSFEGVGVFTDGRLHMGPFTAIAGDGHGYSYSQMINGRPADSHY